MALYHLSGRLARLGSGSGQRAIAQFRDSVLDQVQSTQHVGAVGTINPEAHRRVAVLNHQVAARAPVDADVGDVAEADLGRIRLDQSAEVSVDGYPDRRWTGTISFISSEAEFTPKSVQTFKERINLVYRIKIQLTNPDGVLKPGMPADAVIKVNA